MLIDLDYNKVSRKKVDKGTKEIVIFNYRYNQKNDKFMIKSQDGMTFPMSYYYRKGNTIIMNGHTMGEYKDLSTVKTVLLQLSKSMKSGMKLYTMPPYDVDINKKWYNN